MIQNANVDQQVAVNVQGVKRGQAAQTADIGNSISRQLQLRKGKKYRQAINAANARMAAVQGQQLPGAGDVAIDDVLSDALLKCGIRDIVSREERLGSVDYPLIDGYIVTAATEEQAGQAGKEDDVKG